MPLEKRQEESGGCQPPLFGDSAGSEPLGYQSSVTTMQEMAPVRKEYIMPLEKRQEESGGCQPPLFGDSAGSEPLGYQSSVTTMQLSSVVRSWFSIGPKG